MDRLWYVQVLYLTDEMVTKLSFKITIRNFLRLKPSTVSDLLNQSHFSNPLDQKNTENLETAVYALRQSHI